MAMRRSGKSGERYSRPSYPGLGSSIEQLLRMAEEERDQIIAEARDEAARIVDDAHRQAEEILANAKLQARRLVEPQ
jgi:vacuolar-type H+-ATPase subunit E/Vma4